MAIIALLRASTSCGPVDVLSLSRPESPDVMITDFRFKCCGRALYVCHPLCFSGSIPPQASQFLSMRAASEKGRVTRLAQLVGRVHVRNAQGALSFARLRTSLRTFYLLYGGLQGEVCERGTIGPAMTFGDRKLLRELKGYSSGYFGVLDDGEARSLGLAAPIVRKVRNGFLISRYALRGMYDAHVVHLIEVVGTNGSYRDKEFDVTTELVLRHPWHFWPFS